MVMVNDLRFKVEGWDSERRDVRPFYHLTHPSASCIFLLTFSYLHSAFGLLLPVFCFLYSASYLLPTNDNQKTSGVQLSLQPDSPVSIVGIPEKLSLPLILFLPILGARFSDIVINLEHLSGAFVWQEFV
jgi:hypothetical protein